MRNATASLIVLAALTVTISPAQSAEPAAAASPPTTGSPSSNSAAPQADPDGLSVTPEVLTATGPSSGTSDTSTVGLEYKYKHSFPIGPAVLDQVAQCGAGCSAAMGGNSQLSASGKLGANQNVNVGDLLDFAGTLGMEFYHFATLPPPGATPHGLQWMGDATTSLKVSYEEGPRLSTRQYTYGLSLFGYAAPSTGTFLDKYVTWPSVVVEAARVDPLNDKARQAVDPSLSSYNRAHGRLSTALKLGEVLQRDLRFDFKIDYWREISPSSAIAAAGLDRQTYKAYAVVLVGHGATPDWRIAYASGTVPTDQAAAKVWQLGWTWKFQ